VDDTSYNKVLKFMLYYNWILNIVKKLHENMAEASECMIWKLLFFYQWPSIWGHLAHDESCSPVQFCNVTSCFFHRKILQFVVPRRTVFFSIVLVQAICCSFSVIQGERVEISTEVSNFTPIHTKKTFHQIFTLGHKQVRVSLKINNNPVVQTQDVKCIGVYLDGETM
jgi:hypothetical protein